MGVKMDKVIELITGKRKKQQRQRQQQQQIPSPPPVSPPVPIASSNNDNIVRSRASITSSYATAPSLPTTARSSLLAHPTELDIIYPQLPTRRDITPEIKSMLIEVRERKPRTWEQEMLKRSTERYNEMMGRKGGMREEHRMADWPVFKSTYSVW